MAKRETPELAEYLGPWLLRLVTWALAALIAIPLLLHLFLPLLV